MDEVKEKKLRRIGQIKYDQNQWLGIGQFGSVFRGTFQERQVAVKRVPLDIVNVREENALNSLMNHPNVIKLFHTEKDDDFKVYALELCAASMDDVFLPDDHPNKYKGPLPSDLDVLLQLSEGLRYIHENGFVHRDVKPGNVLISYPKEDGTVLMKWADFGLSKSVSSRGTFTVSAGFKGTMNWIAPEAILGGEESKEPRGTMESDTWSFGCVIFAYLTKGKHPFAGGKKSVLVNISNSDAINLTALPNDHFAFNITREMIQKKPANRIKLADVLKILNRLKEEAHQMPFNVRGALEAGQLYSWEQWNLALKDDHQLFVWSEDVAIEGISVEDPQFKNTRVKLNESDRTKIASVDNNFGRLGIKKEEPGRTELNGEMLQIVGITPGTASKSLNDHHFVSQGKEWEVYPSELGDKLIVKGKGILQEILLFGPSFHSTCHISSTVCMTDGAKEKMKNELLDLCSRQNLKEEELDRIAALLQVGVDPNSTNRYGETPLLLCITRQECQSRFKCLEILLKANQSEQKGGTQDKINLDFENELQRNAVHLLLIEKAGTSNPTDFKSMKLLIDDGINVKSKDIYGRTALHSLCKNYKNENIVEAMKLLVGKDIDVNLVDLWGCTALHYVCENYENKNIVHAMEFLMEKVADVNLKDKDGQTALHRLCENYKKENIVDAMKILIEAGADVDLTDRNGRTTLHLLCHHYKNDNIVDVMKFIIDNGVDVKSKDEWGRTALHVLCWQYKNKNIVEAMKPLIGDAANVQLKDKNGWTALHYLYMYYKNENIVQAMQLLMANGSDVKLMDESGRAALHVLCEHYKNENICGALELLIEKGVDFNLKDNGGRTALHWLCISYQNENIVDALKILIGEGVDVNLTDRFGRIAFHYLCENYKNDNIVDAMKLLIKEDVHVKILDKKGRTALHFLCRNFKNENIVDAMKFLIEKDVMNVNLKDKDGRTALHYLCENYKNDNIVGVMEFLVGKDVDVKLLDDNGRTALHYLCQNYKNENIVDVMNFLVGSGIDVKLTDKTGKTALDCLYENPNKMALRYNHKFLQRIQVEKKIREDEDSPPHHMMIEESFPGFSSEQVSTSQTEISQQTKHHQDRVENSIRIRPKTSQMDIELSFAIAMYAKSRVKIPMDLAKEDSSSIARLFYEEYPSGFRKCTFEWCEGSVYQLFLPDEDERKYHVGLHPLPSPATAILQLVKGLAFIHSKGTFHGDIKPQNALLFVNEKRSRIDLKWADFGLNTNIDISTHEKNEFGLSGIRKAYAWQPAEVIRQYSQVVKDSWQETSEKYISYMKKLSEHRPGSVEADLFSAGCFFFYFLTKGVHPFGQSTEIPTNILDDHPENFSKMPASHYAYKALLKMIHHSPDERGTLDEVIQLFENKRTRELYDICSLRRPEDEDIALMGRLIADEDQPVGINDPNGDGYTPLILLVRSNQNESLLKSIKTLFGSIRQHCGVTCAEVVNKMDPRGTHSIHYLALNYRHSNLLDIVQLLCEKGLDLKGMDEKQSVEVLEFLFLGYSHPNLLDIIELLFKHGLNVRKTLKEPEQELDLEKMNLKRPRREFQRTKTALELLCGRYKHGNLDDIVQLLLANGIEADHSSCPAGNPNCDDGKMLQK